MPATVRTMLQPFWLWDPGIWLVDGTLCFVMSGMRTEDNPTHTWFDMWGSVEAFVAWQGWFSLLLVRIRVSVGWVGHDIVGFPGPDALGLYRYFSIRSQGRSIQLAHDGKIVMVRVAQRQHGGTHLD